ncbi:MAG: hypothetical protein ACRDSP_05695 [Pseudonocardiaceae bacterium]
MPTLWMIVLQHQQSLPSLPAGWIAATIVSVFTGTGFTAMLTARATRRSLDSDSLKKVADATVMLLDPMQAEIKRLETQVQRLTAVAAETTEKFERALRLLHQHNIEWQDR